MLGFGQGAGRQCHTAHPCAWIRCRCFVWPQAPAFRALGFAAVALRGPCPRAREPKCVWVPPLGSAGFHLGTPSKPPRSTGQGPREPCERGSTEPCLHCYKAMAVGSRVFAAPSVLVPHGHTWGNVCGHVVCGRVGLFWGFLWPPCGSCAWVVRAVPLRLLGYCGVHLSQRGPKGALRAGGEDTS